MNLLHRAEKKGQRFQNPVPTTMAGPLTILTKILPRHLANKAETAPKRPLGPFHTDSSMYYRPPETGLRITWFGHAASLVEIDGVRVLIDPVWGKRASPREWLGPVRFFAPTMELEDLPPIDVVLLSHDHYDHLDAFTIKQLATLNVSSRARYVCPLGVGKVLRTCGVDEKHITELDWTQSTTVAGAELGVEIKIAAWPTRHFSGRGLLDRFTTLWNCYVLEGPKHRVLYGGDTGYWDGFGPIAAEYERFDVSMLPIGAFDPLWRAIHMGPEDALQAYRDMGGPEKAGLLMPVHWGLFNLALHGWRQPIDHLTELAGEDVPLFSPTPGEPVDVVAGKEVRSGWWEWKR